MKRLFITLTSALFCAATTVVGQTLVDRFDLAINAEDPAEQSTLVTLATTFAMLAPTTSGVRKASRFEFHSGTGLVDGGVASEKLRTALPDALGLSVSRLAAIADPCDISRHRFDDTDVLLVVHNREGAQAQDAHRCFVAGLWIYHGGGTQSVNVDDWRAPYARILGSVAGGRPAFSGFAVEGD
jgi:hypothetical protein